MQKNIYIIVVAFVFFLGAVNLAKANFNANSQTIVDLGNNGDSQVLGETPVQAPQFDPSFDWFTLQLQTELNIINNTQVGVGDMAQFNWSFN